MSDPLRIESNSVVITNNDIAFFGCSYTKGIGLTDPNTKYTTVVSADLGLTEVNLSKGGTGNYRSFDLFGQTTFNPGSSLVIQLTELSRVRWYDNMIIDQQLSVKPSRELLEVYTDKFLIYDLIRQLRIVVNYCRAQKIKLVVWSIASLNNTELDNTLETYLTKFPEYLFLSKKLNEENSYRVDNGTDGLNSPVGTGHPGPASHKIIATKIIEHYNKLYDNLR
jgi:hypothetical protein